MAPWSPSALNGEYRSEWFSKTDVARSVSVGTSLASSSRVISARPSAVFSVWKTAPCRLAICSRGWGVFS